MPINRKQIGLALALIVTLVLTWRTSQNNATTELAMPTRVVAGAATSAIPNARSTEKLALQKRELVEMQADLFSAPIKPAAPPVRVAREAPARAPQLAPALPFRYLGRWQVGDAQTLSLDYKGDVVTAQAGDVIGGQYKLVAINDNPIQAQFLYIPLNQIQVMHIGAIQ